MAQLGSNKSKFFVWAEADQPISGSTQLNKSRAKFLFIDENLGVTSYEESRPNFTQTLSSLRQNRGYLASAATAAIDFPATVIGIDPTSIPAPGVSTGRVRAGINIGNMYDYSMRLYANVAKQSRDFRPINVEGVATSSSNGSGTATVTITNARPNAVYRMVLQSSGGNVTASTSSAGAAIAITKQDVRTKNSFFEITTGSNQTASLPLTFTGSSVPNPIDPGYYTIERCVHTDANGYPLEDAELILWDATDKAGKYTISYTGNAIVTGRFVNVINKTYNSGTNKTTAEFTISGVQGDRNIAILEFTNVATGGITDLKIMCPSTLGATQSFPDTQKFDANTLTQIAKFDGIRFMDAVLANSNQQVVWGDRMIPTYASYGSSMPYTKPAVACGMPWEDVGALANAVKALNSNFKTVMISLPVLADDTYIANALTTIRDTLDPSIVLRIELSNELWNFGLYFQQYHYNLEQAAIEAATPQRAILNYDGNAGGLELSCRRQGLRSHEIGAIAKQVFGSSFDARVKVVIQWQQADANATGTRICDFIDSHIPYDESIRKNLEFGASAYYNPDSNATNLTIDQVWDSGTFNVANWEALTVDSAKTAAYAYPTGDLPWISYEGGTAVDVQGLTPTQNAQINYDQRIVNKIVEHHHARTDYGGSWLFYFFLDLQNNRSNPWMFQASAFTANDPKTNAIVQLQAESRLAPTKPARSVPCAIEGGRWSAHSQGYGSPQSGNVRLNPGRMTTYMFRLLTAKQISISVAGSTANVQVKLGCVPVGTIAMSSALASVNYPATLQPGVYAVNIKNVESFDVFVDQVSIA